MTIPDSVTTIGDNVFSGCKALKSITIPEGVTSISYGAFEYCDNLTTVYYRGSKEQWDSIIGSDNDALKEAEIIYNYTGE